MKSHITKLNEEIKRLRKENEELQRKNGEYALEIVNLNFKLDLLKSDYEDVILLRLKIEGLKYFIIKNCFDNIDKKNLDNIVQFDPLSGLVQ